MTKFTVSIKLVAILKNSLCFGLNKTKRDFLNCDKTLSTR